MTIDSAIETALAVADALPQNVKTSFASAVARLVTGAAEVPAAWLEGKAQQIRDDAAGRSMVSKAAAQAAVARLNADPALADRALDHFGARILREQSNREFVVAAAAQDLRLNPPTVDAESHISEDWLDMFSRLCEGRSDEDVKLYFAKTLAGEIRQPGSFSPATMHVLSTLSPSTASDFQALCSICITLGERHNDPAVYWDCVSDPGANGLKDFGLSYRNLSRLQSAGLLHHDLNIIRSLPLVALWGRAQISGKVLVPSLPTVEISKKAEGELTKQQNFRIAPLTPAGAELSKIVHAEPNAEYVKAFVAWVENQLPDLTAE